MLTHICVCFHSWFLWPLWNTCSYSAPASALLLVSGFLLPSWCRHIAPTLWISIVVCFYIIQKGYWLYLKNKENCLPTSKEQVNTCVTIWENKLFYLIRWFPGSYKCYKGLITTNYIVNTTQVCNIHCSAEDSLCNCFWNYYLDQREQNKCPLDQWYIL